MVHIRWAQNEAGKVVLDGEPVTVTLSGDLPIPDIHHAFLQALAITRQPRANLMMLYQGWMDTLATYQAAHITGRFTQSLTREQAEARHASLLSYKELAQQIASLRAAATKEKQVTRQVALNLEIRQLQVKQQQASTLL